MQIIEVYDKASVTDFLKVNVLMNAGNPNYIRPLNNEVEEVFNPEKNKQFKYGKACRWVAKTDDGELVGRIAAFISSKYINKGTDFITGCVGFFDCSEATHTVIRRVRMAATSDGDKGPLPGRDTSQR